MKRYFPLWALLGLFLLFAFPDVAMADNCGSLADCFSTQRAAVAATVGLGIFAVILSIGLDFIPVVGQVKGVIEAITGRDMITGEKLETWERAMNLVPFGLGKVSKIADIVDAGGDLGKGLRHTDDIDELVDAGRVGRAEHPTGRVPGDIGGTGSSHPRGGGRTDDDVGGGGSGRDTDIGSGSSRPHDDAADRPPAGNDTASSGGGGGSKPPRDNGGGHGSRGDDGDGPGKPGDDGGSGGRDGDGDGDKPGDGGKDNAADEAAKREQERLKQEMRDSPSSDRWGTLDDGTNQGVKHFADYWERYPERIPSLATRLGVDPADFENTVEGFKNFTAQAERVASSDMVREVNGKTIHYLEGAANPKKGIVVIIKDGKFQSMMPSDPKSFNKLQ
jgi:hypothetical protein